jgi:hypothetical protein
LQEGDLSKEDSEGQLTQTMKETKFKTNPCLIFSSVSSFLPSRGNPSEFRRTTQLLLRQTFKKLAHQLGSSVSDLPNFFHCKEMTRGERGSATRDGDRRRQGYGGRLGYGVEEEEMERRAIFGSRFY